MRVIQIAAGVALGLLAYQVLRKRGFWIGVARVVAGLLALAILGGSAWYIWAYHKDAVRNVVSAAGFAMIGGFVLWATKYLHDHWPTWPRRKRLDVAIGGGGYHFVMSLAMMGPTSTQGRGYAVATFLTMFLTPYAALLFWHWLALRSAVKSAPVPPPSEEG